MDQWIDLHIHTVFSDGLLTPAQVVEQAKRTGLKAVGITDHDSLAGLSEAKKAGASHGVEVVPGLELSTFHEDKDIHILGYFIDRNDEHLLDYLQRFREARYDRAIKMVSNLRDQGVNISVQEIEERAEGINIGRPHFAEVLMEKGYVETFQEAFYRYIGYGSKAYVDKYKIKPEKAIRLIAESQGLSFLAHAGHQIADTLIVQLIKAGLDGIEIIHPNLSDSRTRHLQQIARQHRLLVSGGSDCHGGRNGSCTIGKHRLPYAILEEMKQVLRERTGGEYEYTRISKPEARGR